MPKKTHKHNEIARKNADSVKGRRRRAKRAGLRGREQHSLPPTSPAVSQAATVEPILESE